MKKYTKKIELSSSVELAHPEAYIRLTNGQIVRVLRNEHGRIVAFGRKHIEEFLRETGEEREEETK